MKFLFFSLIVLGTLALFNPGQDDFAAFIAEKAQSVVTDNARETSGEIFGEVAGSITRTLAQALASNAFQRKNYLIFSTYSLDLNGRRAGEKWKFVGFAGQFFETGRPEMLGG